MAAIFTLEFWRVLVGDPVLIVYLIVAGAVGYGIHALIYRGERAALKAQRQLALDQLAGAEKATTALKEELGPSPDARQEARIKELINAQQSVRQTISAAVGLAAGVSTAVGVSAQK